MIQGTDWSKGNESPVKAIGCGSDAAKRTGNRKAGGKTETRLQKVRSKWGVRLQKPWIRQFLHVKYGTADRGGEGDGRGRDTAQLNTEYVGGKTGRWLHSEAKGLRDPRPLRQLLENLGTDR